MSNLWSIPLSSLPDAIKRTAIAKINSEGSTAARETSCIARVTG
jgi:hypothetical protein